jgi:catechol 2,3-dioxygenase-like lactoylglutathione lyase family enzyme
MAGFTGISHISLTVRDLEVSERWYTELFGLTRLLIEHGDGHDFVVLMHPPTQVIIGLHTHRANAGEECSEFVTGLDHVGFAVGSRTDLESWGELLTERGITHSPIVDAPYGHGLSFRDPDNIPLELFALPGT